MKRIAIFVSGSGTNMENVARRVRAGELACEIALVVCDRPDAFAVERARRLGIPVFVIERKEFKTREDFEARISERLKEAGADLLILAGFMRILGPAFVREWKGRLINIHPSLLPKYPGAHAIRDAFEAGAAKTGVTVHYVDEGVDTGPVIRQVEVPVRADDTLETLEARVHAAEYELYPEVIRALLENGPSGPGRSCGR